MKNSHPLNIVLVHGGFVDGSGWEGVYATLKNEGYRVSIVQNPTTSLADDVAATKRTLARLDGPAILVGHSLGGTVLVNALAEQTERKFGAIVLIAAPFIGDGGWSSDDLKSPHDLGARLPRDVPAHIYHGLEDETAPPSHGELYARAVPQARIHRLPGRDHQLNEDLKEVAAAIRSLDAGA